MAEKVPLDESQQFAEGEPEVVINTSPSDFSVSFAGPDGIERENVYPDAAPSDLVALNTAADLSVQSTPSYQERFTEQLDEFKNKPYLQEVEFELKGPDLSWPPSLGSIKMKFRRGLKQTKSYKKEIK